MGTLFTPFASFGVSLLIGNITVVRMPGLGRLIAATPSSAKAA